MLDKIRNSKKIQMDKSVEVLLSQLSKVRTGRANVSLLDSVKINYYGQLTPLNQVAALSCPDARTFMIAPWESPMLKEIETAIVKSDLGMSPQNDGKVIRLRLPDLTEERRKEIVKSIKKTVEEARVAIRMARREANEDTKKLLKEKQISEDQEKRFSEDVQKLTDEYIKKVDKIAVDKEKEIMTV